MSNSKNVSVTKTPVHIPTGKELKVVEDILAAACSGLLASKEAFDNARLEVAKYANNVLYPDFAWYDVKFNGTIEEGSIEESVDFFRQSVTESIPEEITKSPNKVWFDIRKNARHLRDPEQAKKDKAEEKKKHEAREVKRAEAKKQKIVEATNSFALVVNALTPIRDTIAKRDDGDSKQVTKRLTTLLNDYTKKM